jgi:Putative auto-transporter adhesin, head GIN domain
MRIGSIALAVCLTFPILVGARAAVAASALEIRGAAMRVAIVPERRSDVRVIVLQINPRLPIRVRNAGGRIVIAGDVSRRVRGCDAHSVSLWGRGDIAYGALPFVVVRTPLAVRVSVGDAVFGVIGRSASVDLTNKGCGNWTIANTRGRLRLDQAGAGQSRAGSAGSGDLSVAGSGRIAVLSLSDGMIAVSSGSGDIAVDQVSGPMDVRIAGTGDVTVAAGDVSHMDASIAGSGNIRMDGVAQSLNASVAGPGDVVVKHVSGPVTRRVFGSGSVRVGP